MVLGAAQVSLTSFKREYQGEWIGDLIDYMSNNNHSIVDSDVSGDDIWSEKMAEVAGIHYFRVK